MTFCTFALLVQFNGSTLLGSNVGAPGICFLGIIFLDEIFHFSLLVQLNGSTLLISNVGALPAVDQQDGRVESEKVKTEINIVSIMFQVKPEKDVDGQSDPLHSNPGEGSIKVLLRHGCTRFLHK